MTESMVLEPTHGKMGENTRGTGTMVNNMAKVSIARLMEKREKVDGMKVSGWHGWMRLQAVSEIIALLLQSGDNR